jgi:hypothetical protein
MDMKFFKIVNAKNTNISMSKLYNYCIHERSHIASLNHYKILKRKGTKKNPIFFYKTCDTHVKEGRWG